jgi:hypothetical protein
MNRVHRSGRNDIDTSRRIYLENCLMLEMVACLPADGRSRKLARVHCQSLLAETARFEIVPLSPMRETGCCSFQNCTPLQLLCQGCLAAVRVSLLSIIVRGWKLG